jgi:iron(III) transport system permease protein
MPTRVRRALSLPLFSAIAALVILFAVLWWADPRVGRLWLNTAALACGACAIALPFGTAMAVLCFKTDVPGRRAAALLLVGMLFVPLYLVTGAWDAGFGIQGWHTLSTNPHLQHEPWLAGWRAAVWVHGLAAVPWVVLIVGAGLHSVEAEIEEDATTCAAPIAVLWHVSIRRAAPAIGVAALWIATIVMTEISVTDFFQIRTFAEEVYTQAALGSFGYVFGSTPIGPADPLPAIGFWSGMLISVGVAVLVIRGFTKLFADWSDASNRPPWIWRLRSGRWPAAILLALGILLFAGVPLANLAYKAGIFVTATDTGRVRSWSAGRLFTQVAAAPGGFRGEVWLSTWLGAGAATASLACAMPLAWSLRSYSLSLRQWFAPGLRSVAGTPWVRLLAIALCLTVPGPLLGLGVIHLLNRPPGSPFAALAALYDSNFAPWLVQTVRTLPIATLILWPALASVPQVMLDTAATDGTGWWGQLFRIAVPQRWPAIAAAWLIAFAVAIGELAATILVMPPQRGATALSIQVFQLLHYGVDDRVAAICLVMVFVVAMITGIAATLMKRRM